MIRFWIALFLLLPLPAFAGDELYELINERLGWMQLVGAYKHRNHLPIENLDREETVINSAVRSGLRFQLTAASTEAFFRAQISAAKDIQSCWFDRWDNKAPPLSIPDLNTVIRPELIRLGNAINSRLANPALDRALFENTINVDCLSKQARDQIFSALSSIKTYENRLTQVLGSGVLRIGTTGDYAPFSKDDASGNYSGIDIDAAIDLANNLGVQAVFYPTSWPTLLEDLAAGTFDIGMSGISITAERKQVADFTVPYYVGGKTPISLCTDSARFDELAKIDQSHVKLIVNPGGTNEKFLNTHIQAAQKILHEDNRTIFDEIIRGTADLMITDQIEVRLKTKQHPELCATMPGKTLTYQEKAYLLPKEDPLTAEVDLWLRKRIESGRVTTSIEQHL